MGSKEQFMEQRIIMANKEMELDIIQLKKDLESSEKENAMAALKIIEEIKERINNENR